MDENRTDTRSYGENESSPEGGSMGERATSPQAGAKPTGQAPQGAGGDPLMGDPSRKDEAGNDMESGQVNGLGGPGDRTNLSGLAGPEKTNWSQDAERGTDQSES